MSTYSVGGNERDETGLGLKLFALFAGVTIPAWWVPWNACPSAAGCSGSSSARACATWKPPRAAAPASAPAPVTPSTRRREKPTAAGSEGCPVTR